MSPHIFNSLKSISINIVSPGSRSAQYKFKTQKASIKNTTTNDKNNNESSIQCQTFDEPSRLIANQLSITMNRSGNSKQGDEKMPLLGRYRREQASGSASSRNPQSADLAQQQQEQLNEPVCQSPMFGIRRQINLNRCEILSPSCDKTTTTTAAATTIKQSRSSPSLASSKSQASKQEYQELLPQQITRQQIHYAFALMDSNCDGMIDLRDLSQMLANLGVPIDESVLSYIITTVSRRGDHRISESEFLDWLGQFVNVTAGPDERPASASSIVQSVGGGQSLRRYGSGRTRFRLAGGSSGSSLVAKTNNELPENFGPTGRRRGSVGSGLALMRSLSGSSVNDSNQHQHQQQLDSLEQQQREANLIKQKQQQQLDDQEIWKDLRAAFCVFDLDGDGFITFEEVRAGLRLLGEAWTTSEMSRLFSTGHLTPTIAGSPSGASSLASANDLSKQRISIDDFVRLLL